MSIDPLKIVLVLIQPLSIALLLALAAALYAHWLLRALAIVAALVTLALSTPLVAERLAQPLEQRYVAQPLADYGQAQAIVLLGGGVAAAAGGERRMDATAAFDRVYHAAALWRAGKAPRIIATGAGGGATSSWSQAHAMRDTLVALGVDREAVTLEPLARNTRQHPVRVEALLDAPREPFLLVTSAQHMPRSVGRFRAQGMRPIPAPTDFELLRHGNPLDWLPSTPALDRSTRALKERLGLLHLMLFGN